MTADRGSAGLTLILGAVLMVTVALAGVTAVADLALTSARARSAADAAALAAVATSPLAGGGAGADPRAEAQRLAAANRADIVELAPHGWPLRYGVTVAVEPSTTWVRRLVGPVRAGAVAALRPRRTPSPSQTSSVTFGIRGS
jgi:hypothetical protein